MGQTLSHGVYLPNEGERNCYAGLASNWQILNTAVGNIAEKAPLVHTHGNITNDGKVGTTANAPLITGTGGVVQAGAFGNQANTFCEGNDSRLSDARTPVAHTHGKADITDLFNSANTWTGDNTFKGNIYQNQGDANYIIPRGTNTVKGDLTTSGKFALMFKDKNNGNLATSGIGYLTLGQNSSGSYATIGVETIGSTDNARHTNSISLKIDPTTNDNIAQFYPVNNNATDLGISTNQWKSVYAQSYYYNGVAWGLDKANTWTGNNTFTGRTSYVGIYDKFQTTAFDVRTDPESTRGGDIFRFWSGTESTYGDYLGGMSFYQSADGSLTLQLICFGYPQTGNSTQNRINFHSARDGTSDFYPVQNNKINLGTSTNKWKSFNGVNPGALSLPSGAAENINTDNWNFSWSANTVTAPFDGYISIACFGSALQINNETKSYAMTFAPGSDGFICGLLPVSSGDSIKVLVTRTQTSIYEGYKFIKASGNVS